MIESKLVRELLGRSPYYVARTALPGRMLSLESHSYLGVGVVTVGSGAMLFEVDQYVSPGHYLDMQVRGHHYVLECLACHLLPLAASGVFGCLARLRSPDDDLRGIFARTACTATDFGGAPAGKPTVLIVDDDADLREAIRDEFEDLGMSTLQAPDGEAALSRLDSVAEIDAIISDIRMPTLSGVGLFRALAERRGQAPLFFFMSGFADHTPDDAYEQGADGHFSKPFASSGMVEAVASAVELRRQRGADATRLSKFVVGNGGACLEVDRNDPDVFEIVHSDSRPR